MSDPLATYIEDHLAGADYAIDLLQAIRDQYAGEPLADFAASMLIEVEADRATLKRVGAESSGQRPKGLVGLGGGGDQSSEAKARCL